MSRASIERVMISLCLTGFLGSMAIADINADNSMVNKRDQSATELTADQQGTTKKDSEITRLIRKDLVRNKTLSVYAHNVKIITVDGQVTLKGPVKSSEEQNVIVNSAQTVAGVSKVDNQMSVATK